jgi:hypothetical protein
MPAIAAQAVVLVASLVSQVPAPAPAVAPYLRRRTDLPSIQQAQLLPL